MWAREVEFRGGEVGVKRKEKRPDSPAVEDERHFPDRPDIETAGRAVQRVSKQNHLAHPLLRRVTCSQHLRIGLPGAEPLQVRHSLLQQRRHLGLQRVWMPTMPWLAGHQQYCRRSSQLDVS